MAHARLQAPAAARAALQCGSLVRPPGSRAFTLGGTLLQLTPREGAALAVSLARAARHPAVFA